MSTDHRSVKRITRPMIGFKSFDAAQGTLAGIELMHRLKKGHWSGRTKLKASPQLNSSTPWPPNPYTNRSYETLTENLRHNLPIYIAFASVGKTMA